MKAQKVAKESARAAYAAAVKAWKATDTETAEALRITMNEAWDEVLAASSRAAAAAEGKGEMLTVLSVVFVAGLFILGTISFKADTTTLLIFGGMLAVVGALMGIIAIRD